MEKTRIPNEWDVLKIFVERVMPLELKHKKAYRENNREKLNRLDDEVEKWLYRIHKLCLQNDSLEKKWGVILSIGYGLLSCLSGIANKTCHCCSKPDPE